MNNYEAECVQGVLEEFFWRATKYMEAIITAERENVNPSKHADDTIAKCESLIIDFERFRLEMFSKLKTNLNK